MQSGIHSKIIVKQLKIKIFHPSNVPIRRSKTIGNRRQRLHQGGRYYEIFMTVRQTGMWRPAGRYAAFHIADHPFMPLPYKWCFKKNR